MAEELIITISGMRGIVGENLTDSIAADYGSAFGTFLKNIHADKKEKLSVRRQKRKIIGVHRAGFSTQRPNVKSSRNGRVVRRRN
jgi:phosphomannomutase